MDASQKEAEAQGETDTMRCMHACMSYGESGSSDDASASGKSSASCFFPPPYGQTTITLDSRKLC